MWLLYVWPVFFTQLPSASAGDQAHLVRDFLHFYTQGLVTRERNEEALYDATAMAVVADRAVPAVKKEIFPTVYGPQVGLLFAPLAKLPYLLALRVWLILTLVGYAGCVFILWRTSDPPPGIGWTVAVLALGAPGLHFTLSFGQAGLIGLTCFTALWLALRDDHPLLAGVAIGLLSYKPQLGVVAACVFVLRGEWKVVLGAVLAVAVQVLASWAYWGPAIFIRYGHALAQLPGALNYMEPDKQLAYSVRALLAALHVPPTVGAVASVAVGVLAVGYSVSTWRRDRPLAVRYSGLVLATLLINPHLYGYELLLCTPAMLTAGSWAAGHADKGLLAWLVFLYVAPVMSMVAPGPQFLTTLALAGTTIWVLRAMGRSEGVPAFAQISHEVHHLENKGH